jgi:hypothetical protein
VNALPTRPSLANKTTWPKDTQFDATAARLPRPYTVVKVRVHAKNATWAIAWRSPDGWMLSGLIGGKTEGPPDGCADMPCAWPASLTPVSPLSEPPPLAPSLEDEVIYARTLIDFEGPLSLREEGDPGSSERPGDKIPPEVWSDPNGTDLSGYLEALRRYHPVGGCSMDSRPQQVAAMRGQAAAQAGRTGWAVQGWIDTVAYWSSSRFAWSSYGQSHPQGHLALLDAVGVNAETLLIGILVQLPGLDRKLGLADARRVLPDLGPSVKESVRVLAGDERIDPLKRALLFATVASLPFDEAPSYAELPEASRGLLEAWSR